MTEFFYYFLNFEKSCYEEIQRFLGIYNFS
jgi:hypothetical protein